MVSVVAPIRADRFFSFFVVSSFSGSFVGAVIPWFRCPRKVFYTAWNVRSLISKTMYCMPEFVASVVQSCCQILHMLAFSDVRLARVNVGGASCFHFIGMQALVALRKWITKDFFIIKWRRYAAAFFPRLM